MKEIRIVCLQARTSRSRMHQQKIPIHLKDTSHEWQDDVCLHFP